MIALTEAWLGLDNISINNFAINGYTTYFTANNKNQNDSVVVYLKDTLNDISVTEINTQTLTALRITKMSKIDFLIYSIYRSPNSNTDVTLNELYDIILLNSTLQIANYKILLGDLNIDLIKHSKIREEYLLFMAQFGFSPLIKTTTRSTSNTYIDRIFIKTKSFANIVPIIVYSNITNYYPTVLSIGNILNNRNNTPKPLKILKTDNQKLSNSTENYIWSEILEFSDINKATQYFINTINNLKNQALAEISIPSKTKKIETLGHNCDS